VSNQIVITSGTKMKSPIDANGKAVLIAGTNCVFDLTGKCLELKILGKGHKVRAEEVGSLIVSGSESQVSITTLAKASLSGASNQLIWTKAPQSGDPQVALHGVNNHSRRG